MIFQAQRDRLTSICLTADFAFLVYSNETLTLWDLSYHTKFSFPDLLWHVLKGKNSSLTDSERVHYLGANFARAVDNLPISAASVENVSAADNVSAAHSHVSNPFYQMILAICLDEELTNRVFRRAVGTDCSEARDYLEELLTDKEFQDYLNAAHGGRERFISEHQKRFISEHQKRFIGELEKRMTARSLQDSDRLLRKLNPESRVLPSISPFDAFIGLGKESEVNLPKTSQQGLHQLNPFLPLSVLLNRAPEVSAALSKLEDEVKRGESAQADQPLSPEVVLSASNDRPIIIGSAPEIEREEPPQPSQLLFDQLSSELPPSSILKPSQQVAVQGERRNLLPASRGVPAPVVPVPGFFSDLCIEFLTGMAGGAGWPVGEASVGLAGSQSRAPISNQVDSVATAPVDIFAREKANDIIREELARTTLDLSRIIQAIEAGGDSNTFDSRHGLTPLLVAVSKRDVGTVEKLLILHANPNKAFAGGTTPLMIAASQGDSDTVRLLLMAKVNLNALSQVNTTALDEAMGAGRDEVFKMLRSAGAKLGAERSRASINERDRKGETALIRAVKARNVELISDLLDLGADPLVQDNAGVSALYYAQKHPEILRLIHNSFLRDDEIEFSEWSEPQAPVAKPKPDVVIFSDLNAILDLDGYEPLTHKTWDSLIREKGLPYVITTIISYDQCYFFDSASLINWVRNSARTNPITNLPIDPRTVSDYVLTALDRPAMRAECSFMLIAMDLDAERRHMPPSYVFPSAPSHPVSISSVVPSSPVAFRVAPPAPSYPVSTPPYYTTYLVGGSAGRSKAVKEAKAKAKAEADAKARKEVRVKKAAQQAQQKKGKKPGRC